jgi:hypothetical protein
MKRILETLSLVVLLAISAVAQVGLEPTLPVIGFDTAADFGNNSTGTVTGSMTLGSSATLLTACIMGDSVSSGHDDISGATYNSANMTLVDKWVGTDGSHHNNRYMYLYKLVNPSVGASHTLTVTSTNAHFLDVIAASYKYASDLAGHYATFGPSSTSPYATSITSTQGGSVVMMCDGGWQTAAYNTGTTYTTTLRVIGNNHFVHEPAILDSTTPTPQSSVSVTLDTTSTISTEDVVRIMAEILPTNLVPVSWQQDYSASSSWVANASDSGLTSCSYDVSAWDSTTSPYTNLTSSITSNTCDGSFNVTIGFAANQTGTLVITSNPNSCNGGTC